MTRLLYLHGFASSPSSTKVRLIRERLEPDVLTFDAPDLNVPEFRRLSWEAIIGSVVDRVDLNPTVVVGSSLGAMIALECSRRRPDWDCELVLIAPAIGIRGGWVDWLPNDGGTEVEVFHHGSGKEEPINRSFFEEVSLAEADLPTPAKRIRVVMGDQDESISIAGVREKWESWKKSGLPQGSSFREIHGGDHRLVDYLSEVVAEIRIAARL